jgi:hypothetical protein
VGDGWVTKKREGVLVDDDVVPLNLEIDDTGQFPHRTTWTLLTVLICALMVALTVGLLPLGLSDAPVPGQVASTLAVGAGG